MSSPLVSIIMGSSSDKEVMKPAADVLKQFGVPYEFTVVSAHRSPQWMYEFCSQVPDRGIKVIIAGAGGAAHLPGMVAALTTVPVIGVPVKSRNSIDGWDSLLSIVQMPNDVPVATVALNASHNAGILAAQILATHNDELMEKLRSLKKANREKVDGQQEDVKGI